MPTIRAVISLMALISGGVLFLFWLVPLLLAPQRMRKLYKQYFADARRERLFLASLAFFFTFAIARTLAYTIHIGIGPFHNIFIGGKHIHHLVWGIILLIFNGYLWLMQVGTGDENSQRFASRITSIFYGIATGLTLDEFALWLHLEDVYWEHEGRASIDAVVLFSILLVIGLLGGNFFRRVLKEVVRILRRK